jgi:hypothetical protein
MAVLYVSHYQQFFDNDGVSPLSGGRLYTYAAGTTTPKATYTTAAGSIEHPNPIILNSVGIPETGPIFLTGSYKFVLHDADDAPLAGRTTDNVTSFTATGEASDAFFQTWSGDGSTTTFTLSENLGSDEKVVMLFIDNSNRDYVTNGAFATDTGWTKGSGWTIGSGVATATGAISTAIEQTAGFTLEQGVEYVVTMTITRSAGSLTPAVGGTSGTARSASGTFTETIIAGSTQTLAFTGSSFTGTLDNVTVKAGNGKGFEIQPITAFTISGTTLTVPSAPATGTNNVMMFAPSRLAAAASAAADAADVSATQAAASAADALVSEGNAETHKDDAETAKAAAELAQAQAEAAAAAAEAIAGWDGTATPIVFDPSGLTYTDATNVQEAIEDHDAALGAITAGQIDAEASTAGQVLTSDGAGNAEWGVLDAFPSGGYRTGSNYRYAGLGYTGSATGINPSANEIWGRPITISKTTTFTRIGARVKTLGASSAARLGIYEFANGVPGALVLDAGIIDATSTGIKEITISQELQAGVYFICICPNNATAEYFSAVPHPEITNEFFGAFNTADPASTAYGLGKTHTYGALPDPFGTTNVALANNQIPNLWLAVV